MVHLSSVEQLRLRRRGSTGLELKLRYLLERAVPRERYVLDVEFRLPYSLNVTPSNFTTEQFYDNRKLYVRFDTPRMSMEELLDPGNHDSPLLRSERAVAAIRQGARPDQTAFTYESKMLGAVYKSLLRDTTKTLRGAEKARVDQLVSEATQVTDRFHELMHEIGVVQDEEVVEHARLIDEHLSLLLEKYLLDLLKDSDIESVSGAIAHEGRYRSECGYLTGAPVVGDAADLEEYVFREKALKSYVSEVLFFRVRATDQRIRIQHITYAAAAGLAMAVATAIGFFGQSVFGSITTSLFVLLVVSYMLKDRLKDVTRDLFMRSIGRYFYDRRVNLYDTMYRSRLATVQERAAFVKRRRRSGREQQERAGWSMVRPDRSTRFRYTKRVTIYARTLRRIHRRVGGLADTSIIDLEPFLRFAAKLYGIAPVAGDDGEIIPQRVRRVYHVDLVITFTDGSDSMITPVRLSVANGRIVRIEAEEVAESPAVEADES
jgi:hypothetical protein